MLLKMRKDEADVLYIELPFFPKGRGKVIFKTVQARDDKKMLVNLDYDKKGVLVGIEILIHGAG